MNNEHLLILSILKYKDIKSILFNFDDNEFKIEDNKEKFNYIKKHYKKYNSIPTIDIFEKQFGKLQFPEEIEKPSYYSDFIINENNKEKMLLLAKRVGEKVVEGIDLKKINELILLGLRRININYQDVFSGNIGKNIHNRIERYLNIKNNEIKKYKWGFSNIKSSVIDEETPLVGGRLYLIQARPGIGKTFLICATSANLSLMNYKPLFISKEMEVEEVLERIDALASGISYNRLKRGMLSEKEFEHFKKYLLSIQNKLDLEIKNPKICTQTIISQMIEEVNPDIVFIDYLQLLKDDSNAKDKRLQVANIIYDLKSMAQQYKIPIVIISASNRESAKNDTGPSLENISESDAAAFAIDVSFSLFQNEEEKLMNIMNLSCVKNRHGKTFITKLFWNIDDSIIKEI